MTKKDLENAKAAFDNAWINAAKCMDEVRHADNMHDKIQSRDTSEIFLRKSKRAMEAYKNWRQAAAVAANALDSYYKGIRPA